MAWGALAFGANYPWAYTPLAVAAVFVGLAGLVRPAPGSPIAGGVAIGLATTTAAALAQVVALPRAALTAIPQPTEELLRKYDVVYANYSPAATAAHAISVQPAQTLVAVSLLVSFSLFMLGTARVLTRAALTGLTRGLVLIGVVVAIVGLIQRPLFGRTIYGFWTPYQYSNPFGPFVNANHFAGWMLMAVLLTAGYLCGRVGNLARQVAPGWRNNVLRLASPEANEVILVGFAILVMATSLLLTFSRSGIIAFVCGLLMLGAFIVQRARSRVQAIAIAALLMVVVISAIGLVGVDRIGSRFAAGDASDLDGRTGAWLDAWHIARRFAWTGTGLNTYGVATMFYQTADLARHYSQAHNDYLQVAAEGGLLLVVPGMITLAALVTTMVRRHRQTSRRTSEYWIRAGAMAGLFAIAIQELADFSLQMPGNAALFSVLAAIAIRPPSSHRQRTAADREESSRKL